MKNAVNQINLIPADRILERKQLRAFSRWSIVCFLGAFVCGVPVLVVLLASGVAQDTLGLRTFENAGRVESTMQSNQGLQKQLILLNTQSEAVAMLERRIDWGGIFQGLATAAKDRAWLDRVECGTQTGQNAERVEIKIHGYADSQGATRGFVVSLEQIGLFDEVVLDDTTRVFAKDTERIQFGITLVLDPSLVEKGVDR
ncbi:MAG: hypothetical protein JKY96_03640 [Phycisphaerales bacterium]|nr:hypothetical protein [Phycisphaerales bacterium]